MVETVERAREAFGRQSWAEAYELLAAASEHELISPDDLERLAIVAYLVGEDAKSEQAWERAHLECLRLDASDQAVRCAFWLGLGLLLRGETSRAGGWFSRASRLVEEGGLDCVTSGFLLVPAALTALDTGDAATAYTLCSEAGEVAKRFGDKDLLALSWLGRGQASIALGDTARGVALLDEAMVAITTSEVSPIPAGIVYCAVVEACMDVLDLRRAAEWTNALTQWCDAQNGLVPYRGQCLVHRSQILQAHGEWSEAVSEVERARERLSRPPHPALGIAYYQQAELHRLRGAFDDAEQAYRRASECGREPAPGLALLRLRDGRVEAAATAVRRMLDETHDRFSRTALLAAYVEVLLAVGDAVSARVATDELTELASHFAVPLLQATAAYATGSVLLAEGDASAALGALRRACGGWRDLEMPYETARARVLIALACRVLGDHDTAAMELETARGAFDRLGAQPDLAHVMELARETRGAVGANLTARESEVLRLVAAGKTNREIGADLVISEHTVARHVQNIFTKVGLSSRAAATAYAYKVGLV